MSATAKFVLDTSAVLALRGDEPGAARVEDLLRRAEAREVEIQLSFMTRMEVLYRVEADEGPEAADMAIRLIDAMAVGWVSCDPAILERAARIKAAGGLSVADAWIAATALVQDATLVHRDPEFRAVDGLAQEELPSKG